MPYQWGPARVAKSTGSSLACCVGLLLLHACAEPHYGEAPTRERGDAAITALCQAGHCDAGHPSTPPNDAAPPALPDAQVEPEPDASTAMPGTGLQTTQALDALLGSYALRLRFFGHDIALGSLANFSHEKVAYARVTRGSDGTVSLELRVCRDVARLQVPLSAPLTATTQYQERLPSVVFQMDEASGGFFSQAMPRLYGYDAEPPAGCSPGQSLAVGTGKPWLNAGTCTCPSSDAPPTDVADCRVSDPDMDQNPGLSIALSGSRTGQDFVRFRDQSQFSAGQLASDGHHTALWLENNDYYQLQCAGGSCPRSAYGVCTPNVNPVLFAPIPALSGDASSWDCDSLLQQADDGALFPSDALAFPDDC